LRRLGCIQVDHITDTPQVSARPFTLDRGMVRIQEELSFLLARVEGLLGTLGGYQGTPKAPDMNDTLADARRDVEMLVPQVQALTSQRENLEAELASLPRYEVTLRKLLPIIPASARDPGFTMVGILVSRTHIGILDSLGKRILELTSGRAEIVASDVDSATRAMLIVFPDKFINQIEAMLGKEDVSRLRLPAQLGEGPPDRMLEAINRRLIRIPEELKVVDREMAEMSLAWCEKLAGYREFLRDEVDANSVLSRLGETDLTFILVGWVPQRDFEKLQTTLKKEVGEQVLVQRLSFTPELKKRAPVILKNPAPARPFESLVKLLALPTYGHIDPTTLMAFFLPIFFGMILGDVAYGALLLALGLFLLKKLKKGVMRDIAIILVMGSAWAILFGFLYGEAFGTLGEELGMHALWFERASAEQVTGLLIMTLVVGAVHITLGLILGVWEAVKSRSRSHLLERGGMLLGLISLFVIVGVLAGALPQEFKTPAVCGLIIGIVLIGASLGWLGILMGPIEFISLIGNVLSYLRIAAIGLASVYLAKVANEMVGMVGNVIVGVIVALLFHALNLVLGAFSPSIHSLRLHYVEFFRKFYEGGGKAFEPYKSRLEG
jgi:V/A-type H+-transporting ATPase subunit I